MKVATDTTVIEPKDDAQHRLVAICADAEGSGPRQVAERFARCKYFVLVQENGTEEIVENKTAEQPGGAAAAAIAQLGRVGVKLIVGKRFGVKAIDGMKGSGIDSAITTDLSVDEVKQWLKDKVWNEQHLPTAPRQS